MHKLQKKEVELDSFEALSDVVLGISRLSESVSKMRTELMSSNATVAYTLDGLAMNLDTLAESVSALSIALRRLFQSRSNGSKKGTRGQSSS